MADALYLRTKHTTFTYRDYSWELLDGRDLKLSFSYTISPDISFNPSVTIHNVSQKMIDQLGTDILDTYVFQIGLADMFSYWKVTASPTIMIKAGKLTPQAIIFWKKLLLKGMGEFFYQNNIDFSKEDFITFAVESNKEHAQIRKNPGQTELTPQEQPGGRKMKVLIPVGGGKDSAATLELLKNKFECGTFLVSAPKAAQNIIDVSRIPQEKQVVITRVLDPKIYELNESGYLNGHVPISAFLAFLSILTADLFGYSHISLSNERSSNEGNVWYCDQEINHQYSKTFEFERDLQTYTSQFLPQKTPFYFSFMRPLYELQIAQIFSRFSEYHPVFRSCNRGQKQNIWCGECSKCLFAWTILFPFLTPEKLTAYFGQNLFENVHLWQTAQELLGLSGTKPFDCVGTHEETIIAFYLCTQYYAKTNKPLPELLNKVSNELKNNPQLQTGPDGQTDYASRAQTLLSSWNAQNSLPQEFADILKKELEESKTHASNL